MGADHRVFTSQSRKFPSLVVPKWIQPLRGESIAHYAERFAKQIDPGCPCIIGGASFGGIVAGEMAKHLQTRACVLIGSARSPKELPPLIRCFRSVAGLARLLPYGLFLWLAKVIYQLVGRWLPVHYRNLLAQANQSNSLYYHWAVPALLSWTQESAGAEYPVFQVHGEIDRILPVKYVQEPDLVIKGGGHVISMRHGPEVNRFIERLMADL